MFYPFLRRNFGSTSLLFFGCTPSRLDLASVFADGFLHWLIDPTFHKSTAGASTPATAVLSFSLAEETFHNRVRPPPFDWYCHEVHLAVFYGRLCMGRDLRGGSSSCSLEIWSYGAAEDDGHDVWSVEHCIDLAKHAGRYLLTEPLYVRVVGTSQGNVVAYDPMRRTLETILELNFERESRRSLARFSLFNESLSPVH